LDQEPHLAASAPAPQARLAASTAAALGLAAGDRLTVSTKRGSITLPLAIEADMTTLAVHLPAKSPGSWVLERLGATHGSVVKISPAAKEDQP
jgi:NADH-quinone oxidoreductase subunit G